MKAGERDHAWLRVLVPAFGLLVLWLADKFNSGIGLNESAVMIYLIYIMVSLLILIRILLGFKGRKTWHTIALLADTVVLTLLSCWYSDHSIALLALFALPFLGYGICSGQKNLYIAMLVSLVLSGLLFLLDLGMVMVSVASVLTPIGILIVVSFFALYLNAWSKELRHAKDEADQAKKARSVFFANMSHELRTPLHGILGLSGLLNEARLGNIEQRYATQINDAAKIMLSLVDNVLDFTRIEENKFVLRHSLTDLHKFLFKIYRMFFYQAKKNNLILSFEIDPLLHYNAVFGEKHIQQVLINLVANAIKYTDSGFVAIHMRAISKSLLRFEVLDSGRGISDGQKERIFDRFSRCAERQSTEGGTGLGLTISKQIVDAMGGTIGVTSLRGRGSRFWFEVPYRVCPEFEKNCLAEGQVLVLRKGFGKTRLEQIANSHGAKIVVHEDLNSLCKAISQGIFHAIIIAQKFREEYCRLMEPYHLQETPLLITVDQCASEELVRVRDRLGSYYRVDHTIHESVLLNLYHRAIVCKLDYIQKANFPVIRNNVEANTKKIIVAEDNEINQEVISQILSRAGYQLTLAGDGEEALAYFKKIEFDLFIVDSQMPGMSGLETIQEFKRQYPKSNMPIVVLSADVSLDSRTNYYNVGAQKYICKPVEAEVLLALTKKIIESNSIARPTSNEVLYENTVPSDLLYNILSTVKAQGITSVLESKEYSGQKTFDHAHLVQIIRVANSIEYAFSISIRSLTQARLGIESFSQLFYSDVEGAARKMHHIKGALGSIGANRFSMLCGILDKKEILQLINRKEYIIKFLWKEYRHLKDSIENWFDSTMSIRCNTNMQEAVD